MIPRSVLVLAAAAAGIFLLAGGTEAQNYPPYGAQPYPPPRAPLPSAVPDDDDDDLPPQQRATPGYYPPPPGYRGPYAYEPRPPAGVPGVERGDLPPPGVGEPYGTRGPTVIYGDRAPPGPYGNPPPPYGPPPPAYSDRAPPPGPYGAAPPPPPYGPYDAPPRGAYEAPPTQLGPGPDPSYNARPPREVTGTVPPNTVATLPPEDQPENGKAELPPQLRRQMVSYQTNEPPGTIIIDTSNTFLYLVTGNGQAMRYGIGVGREGFTWAGAERVSKMSEWPDWHPPAEMIERQPYLPRFMAGGEGNPLGARALYLGKTLYRIHGTNQPSTIGKYVSSGCIRLTNDDIQDLYSRVQVGTRVVVLPGSAPATAANATPVPPQTYQQR